MRVESFCDTGLSFPLQQSDFPLHQETNCSQLNIGLDDPIYERWVLRRIPFRRAQLLLAIQRRFSIQAGSDLGSAQNASSHGAAHSVQAIKRHQACKRARMLKRIASDVTEPASPDAVRHHMDGYAAFHSILP